MAQNGLNQERKKIINQFVLFMVAYLASTIFYASKYILVGFNEYFFDLKVAECALTVLSGVVPIIYVIHIHASTYSKLVKQQ